MIRAFAQFLILSFCLILRPDCAYAFGSAPNAREISHDSLLEVLLLEHHEIKNGSDSLELINRLGQNLYNKTQDFINNPKNAKILQTQNGMNLLKEQTFLSNFLAVKNHLDHCIKAHDDNELNLKQRILSSSLQTIQKSKDYIVKCKPITKSLDQFFTLNNQVMKALKLNAGQHFVGEMNKQLLTNSLHALIGFKYKFDPNFMKDGVFSQKELEQVISLTCYKKSCDTISLEFTNQLKRDAIAFSKEIKNTNKKLSLIETTNKINDSVSKLNQALSKISIRNDKGIFFDSADLNNPNSKKQFDEYIYNYMNEVSKDAGTLFLTKTLREASGEIKTFDEDSTEKQKKTNQFHFINHKSIDQKTIEKAIIEVNDKIFEQNRDVQKIVMKEAIKKNSSKSINDNRLDEIDELLKINPVAAGQILAHHPEYAGVVCDSINSLKNKNEFNKKVDTYFMLGSAILGGALVLTGVGTFAGAYLLTGSVTAGVAAGTIGGTIMSTTMLAGAVVEGANATYYGVKSIDSFQEMNKFEKALLTENTDSHSLIENRDALLAFKEARMKSLLALAGAGTSVVRLEKFFDLSRFITNGASSIKLPELRALTNIMEGLSQTKVASKIQDVIKLIGESGASKIDDFLLKLAKIGDKTRHRFLELLSNQQITPKKLKEIIDEALEVAKNCKKI